MRQKRFQRGASPKIELTEKDFYILKTVNTHRFIRSTHLCALLRSTQYPLRRLGQLYHAGLLDRPKLQIQYYKSGSEPMVYAMTTKGAKLLGIQKRVEDVDKHPSHHLFRHTLSLTDFMIRMEVSATKAGLPFQRLPIEEWKTNLFYEGKRITRRVIPDAVFTLGDKVYFVENDTGTMPLSRVKNAYQTSILKKQTIYKEAWKNNAFPFPNLRVIFYTNSQECSHAVFTLL